MASEAEQAIQQARRIDVERTAIENEIAALLPNLGPAGMTGPLVDAEGYPRADVDLFLVRTSRQRIIMLQNDLKTKMRELGAALELVHSFGPGVLGPGRGGSPAATAGLLVGDRIAVFGVLGAAAAEAGSATAPPLPTLAQLGQLTRESEGRPLRVVVLRREPGGAAGHSLPASGGGGSAAAPVATVELQLTPQRWAGPGLLGCHVVAVSG